MRSFRAAFIATSSMPSRFIAHLDMDAFYASVELLRYPELRGKPVVIGGRRRIVDELSSPGTVPTLREYFGRGVITTSTYEARAFGVNSGMPLMKAARLAPEALLLPADFDEYRRYRFSNTIEFRLDNLGKGSIDPKAIEPYVKEYDIKFIHKGDVNYYSTTYERISDSTIINNANIKNSFNSKKEKSNNETDDTK